MLTGRGKICSLGLPEADRALSGDLNVMMSTVPAEKCLMTLSHFTGPDSDEPKLELINTQKMLCCALCACASNARMLIVHS